MTTDTNTTATSSTRSNASFARGIIISVVLNLFILVGGTIWVVNTTSFRGHDKPAPFFTSLFALFANLVLVPGILSLAGHKWAKGYWVGSAVFVGFVLICICAFIISH